MRIAVAGQKPLQTHQIHRTWAANKNRADAGCLDQADPAQDESSHDRFANVGGTNRQSPKVRRVEWHRHAPLAPALPDTSDARPQAG